MTDSEMLNEALDLIVEMAGDRICEEMNDNDEVYCTDKCQNINRLCVQRYLEIRKRKEE